jgi:hypothetical protein
MKKSINDVDYTDTTRSSYKIISHKFGYSARITEFWTMLPMVYGKQEFEILDLRTPGIIEFESYLLNELINWKKGLSVDFDYMEKRILDFGEFTGLEKLMFSSGDMQERLWAIFLCLSNPEMNL